jgi:hypothetical protein
VVQTHPQGVGGIVGRWCGVPAGGALFPGSLPSLFYFPLPSYLWTGRTPDPAIPEHGWVYDCINAIAQSISAAPLLLKTGSRKNPTAKTQRKLFRENTLLPKMALIEYVLWSQMPRLIEGGRMGKEQAAGGLSL